MSKSRQIEEKKAVRISKVRKCTCILYLSRGRKAKYEIESGIQSNSASGNDRHDEDHNYVRTEVEGMVTLTRDATRPNEGGSLRSCDRVL